MHLIKQIRTTNDGDDLNKNCFGDKYFSHHPSGDYVPNEYELIEHRFILDLMKPQKGERVLDVG